MKIAQYGGETWYSEPKDYFAHGGTLARLLLEGHEGVELDPESHQRIIDWLDLNAPLYGTYSWNKDEWRRPDPEGEQALRAHIRQRFGDDLAEQPFAALVNVALPEESRILKAPLALAAGGWGQIERRRLEEHRRAGVPEDAPARAGSHPAAALSRHCRHLRPRRRVSVPQLLGPQGAGRTAKTHHRRTVGRRLREPSSDEAWRPVMFIVIEQSRQRSGMCAAMTTSTERCANMPRSRPAARAGASARCASRPGAGRRPTGPTSARCCTVPLTDAKPVIDGKLDEPCWKDAARTGPLKVTRGCSRESQPRRRSSCAMPTSLYVALQCAGKLAATGEAKAGEPAKAKEFVDLLDQLERRSQLLLPDSDYAGRRRQSHLLLQRTHASLARPDVATAVRVRRGTGRRCVDGRVRTALRHLLQEQDARLRDRIQRPTVPAFRDRKSIVGTARSTSPATGEP